DAERGYWSVRQDAIASDEDEGDPMSARTTRVVPYVEDQRNCLLVEPLGAADGHVMASLQAALKSAIQVEFQLEDAELAAEPLPSPEERRLLLFYESAEGGAGVLRRLVDDPGALAEVAHAGLEVCHFDPASGADLGHAPGAIAECEAACYDCLMSYRNQPDHGLLDRKLIRDLLLSLADARVMAAPGPLSRAEHLRRLGRLAGSDLEQKWLRFLDQGGYRLPTEAQRLIEAAHSRPDFHYGPECVAVYVDGPVHAYPDRAKRDADKQAAMEDLGFTVLRFGHDGDWDQTVARYPWVFGKAQ
ncbi:MAG: Zn-binding domain-containing protein, partial [Acidimicrobiales bacterium]